MRLAAYAGTSAVVAAGALLKAFHQRPNFYSATVYLSQSNACILILTNLALVCACSFMYGLQRLFYGPLRPVEAEQLSEKAWYAVLDTLLAMPSLRDDVGGWMLAIFVLLLAGKVWAWIAEGRLDILEQQPPQNPRLFHARLASSLLLSVTFDAYMLQYCLCTVLDDPRPGMMVIFTFEFAILTIFSLFTLSRYLLALCEIRILQNQTKAKMEERRAEIRAERERLQRDEETASNMAGARSPSEDDVDENEIDVPGWEEKRRWLFGLELATDFVKLIIYSAFFAISLTFMGLPMHIMRDVYLTFSAFAKRIQDYGNYRRATQNMNNRYPDASAQELNNENTCIVCREVMVPWEQPEVAAGNPPRPTRMNEGLRAKKLPCGHILHLRCLKAWLERQQACPTCRRPVIAAPSTNRDAPGQGAAPAANVGGQGAAPAMNGQPAAGNAGNPVAPPAQRQNRLRMLNLGPIRIGVYHGPPHQVQEALAQRRNQQMQVGTTSTGTNAISTQVQLMQVEERLMHEARNLAIEQTQLATVRAFEAELARLRALYSQAQSATGITSRPLAQPAFSAQATASFSQQPMSAPVMSTQSLSGGYALPQAFQPLPQQGPLGAGHANLPQGMTLPDGWTLTPLHRVGGTRQQPGLGGHSHQMPQSQSATHPTPTTAWTPAAPDTQNDASTTPTQTNDGIADTTHSSSPQREMLPTGLHTETLQPSSDVQQSTPNVQRQTEASRAKDSSGSSSKNSNPTWGFDWADKEPANTAESEASSETNRPVSDTAESSSMGKGKGKAVTVEDIQDSEE